MTYLEELMQRLNRLSLSLEGQTPTLMQEHISPLTAEGTLEQRRRTDSTALGAVSEQAELPPGAAPGQDAGGTERMLLERFRELSGRLDRVAAIRRQTMLYEEKAAEERNAARTMRTETDDVSGGLLAGSVSTLRSSGLAGYATTRSMAEISRFFERDSRRYGGY